MDKYNQISYGSKGSDVTELQKLLNQKGYNLQTDGIYGKNTQAAVKDYQQKNNLAVDGIVGKNTWGALTGSTSGGSAGTPSAPSAPSAPSTGASGGFQYKPYTPSDSVSQAQALLQQQMAAKPGAYQSTWNDQLNEMIGKILNREEFSYDLNADALYQQYKDRYVQQGKMAMMDTMGQAQAATGGYGNSYAQSVGQQAYQDYLQQLNDVVPELYAQAYDRYAQEGQDLYNQYALISDQENMEYGRYQDELNAYFAELDRLQNQYNAERDYDYNLYADDRNFTYGQYIDDRNYDYQVGRDAVADSQWQKEYDEAIRQYNEQFAYQKDRDKVADAQWEKQYQASLNKNSGDKADSDNTNGVIDNVKPPYANVFTGTTYDEAVAFLKSHGASNAASGLMSKFEWDRRKNSSKVSGVGGPEVVNYNSYEEYLADYVEYAVENYKGTDKKTAATENKKNYNTGGGGGGLGSVLHTRE